MKNFESEEKLIKKNKKYFILFFFSRIILKMNLKKVINDQIYRFEKLFCFSNIKLFKKNLLN